MPDDPRRPETPLSKAGDISVVTRAVPDRGDAPVPVDDRPPVPVRHPGRWLAVAVSVFLAFMVGEAFVTNPDMHWPVVWQYLFDPSVMRGLLLTLELTVAAMAVGIVVGVIIALMRLSPNPVLSRLSAIYVWFIRGTPVIVQLLFWYFLAALFPKVGLGIPYGPTFVEADTNALVGQFMAAVLGLGLSESAYIAEIVRGGIVAVDNGQTEAAQSLGMTRLRTMRWIVIPQAMRVIIPPVANAVINMTKMTAIVLIIGLPDLLTSVQLIYSRNFLQIPLLTVACFWYLVMVSILTVLQAYTERRFGRGVSGLTARRRAWRRRHSTYPVIAAPTAGRHVSGVDDHGERRA
jgi:polar amino acid transport system permease protein